MVDQRQNRRKSWQLGGERQLQKGFQNQLKNIDRGTELSPLSPLPWLASQDVPCLPHPLLTSCDPHPRHLQGQQLQNFLPEWVGGRRKLTVMKPTTQKMHTQGRQRSYHQSKPAWPGAAAFSIQDYIPQHTEQRVLSTRGSNMLKPSEWSSKINYAEPSNSNANSPVQLIGSSAIPSQLPIKKLKSQTPCLEQSLVHSRCSINGS